MFRQHKRGMESWARLPPLLGYPVSCRLPATAGHHWGVIRVHSRKVSGLWQINGGRFELKRLRFGVARKHGAVSLQSVHPYFPPNRLTFFPSGFHPWKTIPIVATS